MRSVVIGVVVMLGSMAFGHAALAQGVLEAPVGHRQPTQSDVAGDDQQSEETGLAKEIDKENRLLDRELQEICRGC